MTHNIVLDTNIVLDWLLFENPACVPLESAWQNRKLRYWANASTLAELSRVLAYPEFALEAERQKAVFDRYRERTNVAETPEPGLEGLPRCRDRDDQKFLELALSCNAEWLVSRDKALLKLKRKPLPFSIDQVADMLAATLQHD